MTTWCKECLHKTVCKYNDGVNQWCVGDFGCPYRKNESLIIELPCKVGDIVYVNTSMQGWYMREKDKPYAARIVFIGINGTDNFMNVDYQNGHMASFSFSQVGKTVFLTREKAEQALEERQNIHDKN